MTIVPGVLGIIAAVVALVATRLEHMAVAMGLGGGCLAIELLGRGQVLGAVALIAGSAVMAAIVLVAVAVIEVDARPSRRLQPWKLVFLAPLVAVALLAARDGVAQAPPTSTRDVAGALIVIGLIALGVPLLVRRTRGSPGPGVAR